MSRIGELVYEDLVARGKKLSTAKEWKAMVERLVEVAGEKDRYDRSDVIKYLAKLRELGHKQNTINKELRPLKLLCQIQVWGEGDRSGFPKLTMPKVKPSDVMRTIFTREEVVKMIVDGRAKLNMRELRYLALATVYGLRREELANLSKDDVNKDGTLRVRTVHGGPETVHLIPERLHDYLVDFEPCSPDYMGTIFKRIMVKLGMYKGERFGWHSIRRSLATELLLADASGLNIVRFMRWSDASFKGEFGMLTIYAQKDQARIDSEIFKVHPFLEYW